MKILYMLLLFQFDDQIEEKSNNNDSVLVRNIMPLLENALCSTEPVAVLHTRTNESESLIKEVSQLASECKHNYN